MFFGFCQFAGVVAAFLSVYSLCILVVAHLTFNRNMLKDLSLKHFVTFLYTCTFSWLSYLRLRLSDSKTCLIIMMIIIRGQNRGVQVSLTSVFFIYCINTFKQWCQLSVGCWNSLTIVIAMLKTADGDSNTEFWYRNILQLSCVTYTMFIV